MKGTYNDDTFVFEFGGRYWELSNSFYHGYSTGYSVALQDFVNDSAEKWNNQGVLITSEKLWNALTEEQKNIVAPKIAMMFWDENDNEEIPQWVKTWQMMGLTALIKQISNTEVIFLRKDEWLETYFDEVEEPEEPPAQEGGWEIVIPETKIIIRRL